MSTTATAFIDLRAFCGTRESRYSINEPWVSKGFEYATDGQICVRVPTSRPEKGLADGRPAPPAADVFKGPFHGADVSLPWPAGPYEAECPDCLGLGIKICCSCGHEDECPLCKGYGRYALEFDGMKINARHADRIRLLPNVKYARVEPGKVMPFVFDGGEGVVKTLV
jgi:hypothetical protein